jgi:hypothetical protein
MTRRTFLMKCRRVDICWEIEYRYAKKNGDVDEASGSAEIRELGRSKM